MARPKWLNPVNPLAHPGRAKYWAPSKGEEMEKAREKTIRRSTKVTNTKDKK